MLLPDILSKMSGQDPPNNSTATPKYRIDGAMVNLTSETLDL